MNPKVLKDTQILHSPPLIGRLFIFERANSDQTEVILYWYEKLAFKTGEVWSSKYIKASLLAFMDGFVGTAEIKSPTDHASLEKKLVPIAQSIANHWEPIKEWSGFTVAFAGWGQSIAIMSIIASSSIVTVLHLMRSKEEGRATRSAYKRLTWHSTFSEEEKQILRVLKTLSENGETSVIELAKSYEQRTGSKIDPKRITEMVRHLEGFNLAERKVVKKNDMPYFVYVASVVP